MNIQGLSELLNKHLAALNQAKGNNYEYELRLGKISKNEDNGKTFFDTNLTEPVFEKLLEKVQALEWESIENATVFDYKYENNRVRTDEQGNLLSCVNKESLDRTDLTLDEANFDLRISLAIEHERPFLGEISEIEDTKRPKHQLVYKSKNYALEFTKTNYGGTDFFQLEIEVKNYSDAETTTDEILEVLTLLSN